MAGRPIFCVLQMGHRMCFSFQIAITAIRHTRLELEGLMNIKKWPEVNKIVLINILQSKSKLLLGLTAVVLLGQIQSSDAQENQNKVIYYEYCHPADDISRHIHPAEMACLVTWHMLDWKCEEMKGKTVPGPDSPILTLKTQTGDKEKLQWCCKWSIGCVVS